MRQIIAIATIVFSSLTAQAQEAGPVNNGNNDLKFNALYGVFEALEIEYERILNQNTSVGMAASYWFGEVDDYDFLAIPYFRFYPAEKAHAEGFFIEANFAIVSSTSFVYDGWQPYSYFATPEEKNHVSFGAGVAVGGKFVSKSGFFGEVFGGLGREFNEQTYIDFYPRAGISLGKRFGR